MVFAGRVGAGLHVVVRHPGDIRTTDSFLATIAVVVGEKVRRGAVLGTSGGTGAGHAAGVLHFGVRVGATYVDPMLLFEPGRPRRRRAPRRTPGRAGGDHPAAAGGPQFPAASGRPSSAPSGSTPARRAATGVVERRAAGIPARPSPGRPRRRDSARRAERRRRRRSNARAALRGRSSRWSREPSSPSAASPWRGAAGEVALRIGTVIGPVRPGPFRRTPTTLPPGPVAPGPGTVVGHQRSATTRSHLMTPARDPEVAPPELPVRRPRGRKHQPREARPWPS